MADAIRAGDVVQLKSGGPKMTVEEVKSWNGTISAQCEWFTGDKAQSGVFALTSLKLVVQTQEVVMKPGPGPWS